MDRNEALGNISLVALILFVGYAFFPMHLFYSAMSEPWAKCLALGCITVLIMILMEEK